MTQRVEGQGLSFDAVMALPLEDLEKMTLIEAVEEGPTVHQIEAALWSKLFARLDRLEGNQARLESALKAHGVGAWAGLA